jgi:hypothetical protein
LNHRKPSLSSSSSAHFFLGSAVNSLFNTTMKLAIAFSVLASASAFAPHQSVGYTAATSSTALSMKYKVAVVGGGPAGACAAEIFAQEKGIDTVLFERKLDNAKPCGGAIPLCMVGEFDLPETVVDRKVCLFLVLLIDLLRLFSAESLLRGNLLFLLVLLLLSFVSNNGSAASSQHTRSCRQIFAKTRGS